MPTAYITPTRQYFLCHDYVEELSKHGFYISCSASRQIMKF